MLQVYTSLSPTNRKFLFLILLGAFSKVGLDYVFTAELLTTTETMMSCIMCEVFTDVNFGYPVSFIKYCPVYIINFSFTISNF